MAEISEEQLSVDTVTDNLSPLRRVSKCAPLLIKEVQNKESYACIVKIK